MFRKILYLFIITIISVSCTGTKVFTESGQRIPPKANRIFILTKDSPDEAFHKIGTILQTNGYIIDYADPTLNAINATKNKVGTEGILHAPIKETLHIAVMKGENNYAKIQISGTCGTTHIQTRLYGMKKSAVRQCWNAMYSLAKKYKDAQLKFAIK